MNLSLRVPNSRRNNCIEVLILLLVALFCITNITFQIIRICLFSRILYTQSSCALTFAKGTSLRETSRWTSWHHETETLVVTQQSTRRPRKTLYLCINQRDAQILVNSLYFFVKWLYMFRPIISPSSGATFNKLYGAIGTFVLVHLAAVWI